MTPGDNPEKHPPEQQSDDDEVLDLDFEDIVDFGPDENDSSASAIEGVEMLDFLDDDAVEDEQSDADLEEASSDETAPPVRAESTPMDMTIDLASLNEEEQLEEAEIANLDDLEMADAVEDSSADGASPSEENASTVIEAIQPIETEEDEIVELSSIEPVSEIDDDLNDDEVAEDLWPSEDDADIPTVDEAIDIVDDAEGPPTQDDEEAVVEDESDAEVGEVDELEPLNASVDEAEESDEGFEEITPIDDEIEGDEGEAFVAEAAEVDEVESLEDEISPVDEAASDEDDFLSALDAGDGTDDDMFPTLETSDATVNHKREPTEISDVSPAEPNVDDISEVEDASEVEDIEEEFALREENDADAGGFPGLDTSSTGSGSGDMNFAAAVSAGASGATSAGGAQQPTKKSSLPMILIALFALLLLGGAGVGGLYFAGLIPGLGGGTDVAENPTDGGTGTDGTPPGGVNELTAKVNSAEAQLETLYRGARTGEQIDGEQLKEAQQLLADLEANDPTVFEAVQHHAPRFEQLAKDFQAQEKVAADAARSQKFRDAFEIAAANRPESIDQGFLEEARKHANRNELKLIAALEQEVADHQAEQQRMAAEKLATEKQAAFDAVVQAVASRSSVQYEEMLNAYAAAYPEDSQSADMQAIAKDDASAMHLVGQWNALLETWSMQDLSDTTPQMATEMISKAKLFQSSGASVLPGAAEVDARIAALEAIAQGNKAVDDTRTSLMDAFSAAANSASFVFAKTSGERYYTAERPSKNGDNYVVNRFVDLAGKTEPVELAPADADRANTGATTVAATSKAVNDAVAALAADNARDPLWQAIGLVLADEKLDPVIKAQWLVTLAEAAGKLEDGLKPAVAPYQQLSETGVDASFNWADADAAAKVRSACADAVAALPKIGDQRKLATEATPPAGKFSVATRFQPVAVAIRDGENWNMTVLENAPTVGELFVYVKNDQNVFSKSSMGGLQDGKVELADDVGDGLIKSGRILYAEMPVAEDDAADASESTDANDPPETGGTAEEASGIESVIEEVPSDVPASLE